MSKLSSDSAPQFSPKKFKLRYNQPTFQWKAHCFFCNKKVISKHKNLYPEYCRVGEKEELLQLIHKIRKRCDELNDNFAANVRKQLSNSKDLVADEAVYHAQYHSQFFLNTCSADGNRGRRKCPKMQADWMENEIDPFTYEDFQLKMEELSNDEEHSVKRIKQKFKSK